MQSNEIAFLSAAATARAAKAGELSPVDAVQAYLDRIDRLDSRLAAYITVTREEAMDAAKQVEWRVSSQGDAGPLAGVPVAVKDQFWTDGILTSNGSRVYRDFVPNEDATVVRRLKDAGATLLGKLNLSELAMGGTQEPPWGIPANPWDLDRTPQRFGSGALGPSLRRLHRGGHGRVRTRPCGLLRRGGSASHVHPRQPVRHDPHVLVHGRGGAHDQNRGGLRHRTGRYRRP